MENIDYLKLSKSYLNILNSVKKETKPEDKNILRDKFINYLKENNLTLETKKDFTLLEFLMKENILKNLTNEDKEHLGYFWEEEIENKITEEIYIIIEDNKNNKIIDLEIKEYYKGKK